jgi:hypothetical protein
MKRSASLGDMQEAAAFVGDAPLTELKKEVQKNSILGHIEQLQNQLKSIQETNPSPTPKKVNNG